MSKVYKKSGLNLDSVQDVRIKNYPSLNAVKAIISNLRPGEIVTIYNENESYVARVNNLGTDIELLSSSGSATNEGKGAVYIFDTYSQYETAKSLPEGEDGYIVDGALVVIEEDLNPVTGQDIVN